MKEWLKKLVEDERRNAPSCASLYSAEFHTQMNEEGIRETGADPRCSVCGWPLVEDIKDGCTKESCSMRPRPSSPQIQTHSQTALDVLDRSREKLEASGAAGEPPWIVFDEVAVQFKEKAEQRLSIERKLEAANAEIQRLREELAAVGDWRCFHCGEVFHDRLEAFDHFGPDEPYEKLLPACIDPLRNDEKERIKQLRDAQVYALQIQEKLNESEDRKDDDSSVLAAFRYEIGDLFGEVGGFRASTPQEAWLVLDAMKGRAMASEEERDVAIAAMKQFVGVIVRRQEQLKTGSGVVIASILGIARELFHKYQMTGNEPKPPAWIEAAQEVVQSYIPKDEWDCIGGDLLDSLRRLRDTAPDDWRK